MKPFLFHAILRSSFLILWVSQWETEASSSDICEEDLPIAELVVSGSSFKEYSVKKHEINELFFCHVYPTHVLNCSWSFHTLEKDAQLAVHISICGAETSVYSWSNSSEERAGSWSWFIQEHWPIDVIIQFNMSLPDKWKLYTYMYDRDVLEVLPPPLNFSASVKDGNLLAKWDPPASQNANPQDCFEYELDLGDGERIKNLTNKLSYTELTDPTHTYRLRIRARKTEACFGGRQWSDWSHTVTVERSLYKLNKLVIISISFGIPMILLAVLLLVRHQRVSKLLFPPIPQPPLKYIHFLEKSDTPSFFYPAQAAKVEEEIIEVQYTDDSMGMK